VAKLSPSGEHLWSTYLGGSGDDRGFGVALDASGNVVVTGITQSSGWVSGGFDTSYNGGIYDAFVARVADHALAGDANGDCTVNILDLFFIRQRLNQAVTTGDNWQADVNSDAAINVLDLIYVRDRLNTKCP